MAALQQLKAISHFLDNYWARSQVFRTAQFSSALLSGVLEKSCPVESGKLMKISCAISNMRIMLRLLDDIPNLVQVLVTWKNGTVFEKFSWIVNSLCGQLYYPLEHVAWAADNSLLPINSSPVWTMAVVLWALPLMLSLIHKLHQLVKVHVQLHWIHREGVHGTSNSSSSSSLLWLQQRQIQLLLDVVQLLCDLTIAVFWMPVGFLWGGKLSAVRWGALGTISSIIGLYKTISGQ